MDALAEPRRDPRPAGDTRSLAGGGGVSETFSRMIACRPDCSDTERTRPTGHGGALSEPDAIGHYYLRYATPSAFDASPTTSAVVSVLCQRITHRLMPPLAAR
jgi:hypothetical protein